MLRKHESAVRRPGGKAAATGAGLLLAAGMLIGAAPSQAAEQVTPAASHDCSWHHTNPDPGSGHMVGSHWLHLGPYGECGAIAQPSSSVTLYYHCYVTNAYGNTWTHLRIAGTNIEGWVSDADLDDGGSFYHC